MTLSTALSENQVSRASAFAVGFVDNITATTNLPQKVTIFSPINDNIANSVLADPIIFNQRYTFTNASDVFKKFGICPAYLIARILKPFTGGGVNTSFDIFPIKETDANPTQYDLSITGDNTKNVSYNIVVNGRKFNDGKQIEFTLEPSDTLAQKLEKITNATNGNIFSTLKAEVSIAPPRGVTVTTIDLTQNIDNLLDMSDGGMTIITNNNSYDITVNTKGVSGGITTKDLSSNLSGILAVANGSFGISQDGGINKEILFKNTGEASTLITQSMESNFKNFNNIVGNLKFKQDTTETDIVIDTSALPAIQTCDILDNTKLTALKTLNDASFTIQTDNEASPIDIIVDCTTINTVNDFINLVNRELQASNVSATLEKAITNNRVIFKTSNGGASRTISITATTPTAGTDITGATYLNIAAILKENGINAIANNSLPATIQGFSERFNREFKNESDSIHFISAYTMDQKELIFPSIDPRDVNPIIITNNGGVDLTNENYLDVANIYNYTGTTAIDNNAKLSDFLQLQFKKADLGGVLFDVNQSKFTFSSKNISSNSSIVMSPGTMGTDLADSSHFDSANATTNQGIDKSISLQELVLAMNTQIIGGDVSITLVDNTIEFANTSDTGVGSVLSLVNLASHTGEQMVDDTLLDIVNAMEVSGADEVDSVLFSSKWSGISAKDLHIDITTNQKEDDITTFILNQKQLGGGNYDLSTAIGNLGEVWTTIICNVYGADVFDLFEQVNGVPDPNTGGTGRWTSTVFKPFIVYTGSTEDDIDKLLKVAENRTLDLTNSLAVAPRSKCFPFEVAGARAFLSATIYENTPHRTIAGKFYSDIPTPDDYEIGGINDLANRQRLVLGGVSTVSLNPNDGRYKVEDDITFRRPNNQIATALDFSQIRNIIGIDFNVGYNFKLLNERFFMDKTIVLDDTAIVVAGTIKLKDIKAKVTTFFSSLEQKALILDDEYCIDTLKVGTGDTNPKRNEIVFGYERTETIGVSSTTANASFAFGLAE